MAAAGNVVFFPWVRQGAAAAIGIADTLGAGQRGAVDLTAALAINAAPPVPMTVRLRGPADVIGVDQHEIVRTDPRPATADFEPNNFAAIEFDRPDFPWLFTPATASGPGRLRPWLVLVVVRAQPGVTLRGGTDGPLPAIEIAPPARPVDELPDLGQSWLWAHAQLAGGIEGQLGTALGGDPELSLSRLLCPRLLEPNADYIACVVPAFELGCKAGLGQDIPDAALTDANGLKPAWSLTPAPATVTLPVYHHWQFRTGEGGDFQSLVELLRARPVPSGLGTRPIDISRPGFPVAIEEGTTLGLEGALRPIDPAAPPPVPVPPAFQGELAKIVNAPGISEALDPTDDPLLAPPLYGRWHAARTTATPGAAPWFDELNLDPRQRSVAAFGTRVVQEHQEALMAAAWEQAADLQRVNQRLRQMQVSLVVGSSLHARHFKNMSEEGVVRVGAPAFARLRADAAVNSSAKTLVASLNATLLPVRAASPAMRRVARVRGPISRRAAAQGVTRSTTHTWLAKMNTGTSAAWVGQPRLDLVTVDLIRQRIPLPSTILPFPLVTDRAVELGMGNNSFRVVPEGQPVPVGIIVGMPQFFDTPEAKLFRTVARTHLARINPARQAAALPALQPLAMNVAREGILQQLEPARTLTALARAVVATGPNATPPTSAAPDAALPIDTVMAAPTFRQAMYEPLRDLSHELLLPGLETVLPNTVLGLQTNRRFVEAYMVGLNFEMGRELLWRGFPTDQRGTCFAQFWDTRGSTAPRADVRPLHLWENGVLGHGQVPPVRDQFVMLLRSDLLRRYPTAVIYAVRAVMIDGVRTPSFNPGDEVYPAFRGSIPPDVSFFGFDLTAHEVIGDSAPSPSRRRAFNPGYFIVIQEQPSEPRFGFDVGTPLGGGTHLRVGAVPPAGVELDGFDWGRNAAHMAGITRQQPVRIAIHASQFVAQPATSGVR